MIDLVAMAEWLERAEKQLPDALEQRADGKWYMRPWSKTAWQVKQTAEQTADR